jgi:hypothetical protein
LLIERRRYWFNYDMAALAALADAYRDILDDVGHVFRTPTGLVELYARLDPSLVALNTAGGRDVTSWTFRRLTPASPTA